jgi:hypothetical protein
MGETFPCERTRQFRFHDLADRPALQAACRQSFQNQSLDVDTNIHTRAAAPLL